MANQELPYPIIPAADVQVLADAPILKAIEAINRTDARIALVVDAQGRMLGSLTDGDIRRSLLKGCRLESPASAAMHVNPFVMPAGSTRQQILEGMHAAQVKQMPLLESDGRLLGIAVYDMMTGFAPVARSNPVVIMAGGKGKRLLPITQEIPKPMVDIGGKPMLEHILAQFIKQGFSNFHISLNYLGEKIEQYFGDGSKWHCNIHYIREPEFLGTAGALSLMETPNEPFILINGDILTSVDFCALMDYHVANDSSATVCVRAHRVEVPFGVIQIKDGQMQAIVEKPVYEDLISAGIYALDPEVLLHVPKDRSIDMPDVLQSLLSDNRKVAVFPLHEDWGDVGRIDDLMQAKQRHKVSGS